ncbi:MAG: hypothetical protein OXB84_07350 [Halobacteriovoraceae bacterium]|nr:hypothetical protein [Halobacteriovoraceae bacterium]
MERIKINSLKDKKNYCEDKKDENIVVGSDRYAVDNFKAFLKSVGKKKKISFIDKVVLWGLLQMNYRPDITSPSARFQAWILHKNKSKYWDFYMKSQKERDVFSYFYGLEQLLSFYKSKYNLSGLAMILQKHYNYPFYVNQNLAQTLIEKQKDFTKNKHLKSAYYKADWPLQVGESLKKIPYLKLIKLYRKKKNRNYKTNNYLFPYHSLSKVEGLQISCNKDLNLYKHFAYLADNKNYPANTFALEDGKGNMFLGYVSQGRDGHQNFADTFLLKGNPTLRPAVFCRVAVDEKELFLMSTEGRDPGQYLFQLIEKKIYKSNNFQEVDEMLRSARRFYLLNPLRVLYESEKGGEEELDKILASSVPVYHGKNLGNVWVYGKLPNNTRGFILEARSKWELSCLEGKQ